MGWRLGIDVGGTFTDIVALGDDGRVRLRKISSTPHDPAAGLSRALQEFTGSRDSEIDLLIHGTTLATNALLERTGARTVLVTTAGFEDLLWLRRQDRPSLYDLRADWPRPLVERADVIGVRERMGPRGALLRLTEREVARVVRVVRARRPEGVAVCLLFGFLHPEHETRLVQALRRALGEVAVAAGSEVLPVVREYERTSTTTAEVYLRPIVATYVARARRAVPSRPGGNLRIMTSNGGTATAEACVSRSASLALSGPAGGVVGASLVGRLTGIRDMLTLDMGGTSADASLISGGHTLAEGSTVVGGIPLALPAILIETVSAGGGSIAWVDEGGALKVGPRSAGAVPGPCGYGRGGTEATVTDACLVLGWLSHDQLLGDGIRLDRGAAEQAITPLARALGRDRDACAVARGIIEVATAAMARALKRVSVTRGFDPRRMALLPFGGAGPLFGCALADALGMSTIVIPPHPGVLSALGLATASEQEELILPLHRPLAALADTELERGFKLLLDRVNGGPEVSTARFADCRFAGQGYEITVPLSGSDPVQLGNEFLETHRRRYGYADATFAIEIVNLRVRVTRGPPFESPGVVGRRGAVPPPTPLRRDIVLRRSLPGIAEAVAESWPLGELPAGMEIRGPAVLAGPDATGLIEPGWVGRVQEAGVLLLTRERVR
jgi:N-methylhydantoinase A